MLSDQPQTPQSPSQALAALPDLSNKSSSPRMNNSLPTPAHSINGSINASSMDSSNDAASQGFDLSHKRKRDIEDDGDREKRKIQVRDGRISIDDLHLDVGKKYLLCRTPHPVAQPNPSEDLFDIYSLNGLADSVMRGHPDRSKNVNVRKTYKGYLKRLGLSGAFDAVSKDNEDPDTLLALLLPPDDDWNSQNIRGKGIEGGISESRLVAMGQAFTMKKGTLPKDAWNMSVLGEVIAPATTAKPAKAALPNGVKTTLPQSPGMLRVPSKGELPRPKRNVKKRTYGDSSFEGYGEGFLDDDLQEGGYSTGDGEDRTGSRKRPKKTMPGHGFQGGPVRHNSYGPGMVGA